MKNHKPEWYARLRKGPFGETVFDSKMQQEVEARVRQGAKSPKRRLNPWAAAVVAAVFLIIAFILVPALSQPFGSFRQAGGNDTTQIGPTVEETSTSEPTTTVPPATDVPPINTEMPTPNEGVRAIGDTSFGLFQLRPKKGGDEKIQPLGTPSCLGQETDLQFAGDYEIYFHNRSGEETLVQQFKQLDMIQRENNTIEFMKLDFPNLEMYLFLPRYADCHGLEFYAYGIDKETGEVTNFSFLNGEVTYPNWITSPVNMPQSVEGKLVVEGGRGAGQDGATRYVYVPELAKQQLVLESKEQIP
jgi:hypothetical protein